MNWITSRIKGDVVIWAIVIILSIFHYWQYTVRPEALPTKSRLEHRILPYQAIDDDPWRFVFNVPGSQG